MKMTRGEAPRTAISGGRARISRAMLVGLSVFALAFGYLAWSPSAHAESCSSATQKLVSIQKRLVGQRRTERNIVKQLEEVRSDFAKAHRQRDKWKRAAKKYKCDRKGADSGKCAKAESEISFWNGQMRKLQRQEGTWLREQRKNGFAQALARERRAKKVRKASCGGLPAPAKPKQTPEEARARAIQREAARIGIGIVGGIIANQGPAGGNAPVRKCHRNRTTGQVDCSSK